MDIVILSVALNPEANTREQTGIKSPAVLPERECDLDKPTSIRQRDIALIADMPSF
jgi:hypothetical protein